MHEDSFPSRYIPEDAIYLVGKGGTLPAGQTLAGLYPGYTGSSAGVDLAHWLGNAAPRRSRRSPPTARRPGGCDPRRACRHGDAVATSPGSTTPVTTTTTGTTTG